MTAQILIPDVESDADSQEFRRLFEEISPEGVELVMHVGQPESDEHWQELTRHADAIILNWRLPDTVLETAPKLRTVSFLGTGAADHLNLPLAEARGITVRTVSGYSDEAVSELTFALLLAVARRVPQLHQQMQAGTWAPETGIQLAGRTLGLIGYGGIGRRVAAIAHAFGMRVQVWNRSPVRDDSVQQVSFDELLTSSDIVSLHLSLTPETEGILGSRELERLREGAIVINTARGALIDEDALLAALETGRLHGAGLDVFAEEPAPADSPLISHPRVVATPHIGYATADAERELLKRGLLNALGRQE